MTNDELIARFEAGELPPQSFHHSDHVRLAFAYLTRFAALEALRRFVDALKGYAGRLGNSGLYHETITYAYFFLIHERMARMSSLEWDEFANQNEDLLEWKSGILEQYYREPTLRSDLARSVFVLPDRSVAPDGERRSE